MVSACARLGIMRLVVIALSLCGVLIGCASAERQHFGANAQCAPFGYASMSAEGVLTIRILQPSADLVSVYAPIHPAYRSWVNWAGNPTPGQSRPIPRYAGMVSMASDGVVTVIEGGGAEGGVVVEPRQITIPPGDWRYQQAVDRVGGLEPGQFKPIPAAVRPECEVAPASGV